MFRVNQEVKRNDTGEKLVVLEVLPVGLTVFYRVEYENGDRSLVLGSKLRPCN